MLSAYVESMVSVITNDGRHIVGTLKGVDQVINVVLEDCHERIYNEDGIEQVPLGLFIIRGDNVAVVGEVDVDAESRLDFSLIRNARAIPPIVH